MDVHEQNLRRYVIRLDRESSSKLLELALSLHQSPSDLLFWLIWHWLKADGIVTFGMAKSK